jgi:hypothetical protein
VIFYVAREIEKQEDVFFPDITIVNIPVATIRKRDNGYLVDRTGVTGILKGNNCVSDIVLYLKGIFDFYQVSDNQFIGEIIHAAGYDPIEYGYPPSAGDPRSSYYGGNHAHLGTKGNGFRYEHPTFPKNNNIFNYLEEINGTNILKTSIIQSKVAPKTEVPPSVETPQEETPQQETENVAEYSSTEIDEALNSVADVSEPSFEATPEQEPEQEQEQEEEEPSEGEEIDVESDEEDDDPSYEVESGDEVEVE